MAKRSITDEEIGLVKAMLGRGMRNSTIQFYFNRPDRQVNSGRITNIGDGTYSNAAAIPAATDIELDTFLASYTNAHGATTASPSTPAPAGPVDKQTVEAMFEEETGGIWRLRAGETDEHECKANFGFKYASTWLRAVAALANNRGGYILFGVHDADQTKAGGIDKSYAVTGLTSDEFVKADPADFTKQLKAKLDPTPRVRSAVACIGGKTIGVLHVEQHAGRPVIVTKQDGDLREGDIFFRYPGQSSRIKYADLRAILDARDTEARQQVLPLVERLLRLGPDRALVADLDAGVLDDGKRPITIDPALVAQLTFIREGEFSEVEGAPTLRLVGEVHTTSGGGSFDSRGVLTDANLLLNFLKRETLFKPEEYIRYAVEASHAEWLPIFYFARKASLDKAALVDFVQNLDGSARRRGKFVERAKGERTALYAYVGSPASTLKRIVAGDLIGPTTSKEASNIAMALCGLTSLSGLDSGQLLGLILTCYEFAHADAKQAGMSNVRRAACRLDELLYSGT